MKLDAISENDIEAIMVIENSCHHFPWSEKVLVSSLSGRYFNSLLRSDLGIAGFFIAEQAGPDITLMDICIAPDYQGLGYSKLLMSELIREAEKRQAENIFLEVRATNIPAQHLYQHFGFCEVGIRKNYYPGENGKEDAILMAFSII